MSAAKSLIVKVISSALGNNFIRRVHYSHKVVPNSQLHFGVFLEGQLHGVMSFGPSLDKSKIQGLVAGTGWNEFIELNRLAFDEALPKNSESRAIMIAIKLLKKHAPHIKWIISYADATQCGDGTIYRACGFTLTAIKKNKALYRMPENNTIVHKLSLTAHGNSGNVIHEMAVKTGQDKLGFFEMTKGKASVGNFMRQIGGQLLEGFQIRYIYFIDKNKLKDLTVPALPYSAIKEAGASMYKGVCAGSIIGSTPGDQLGNDGSIPISALQEANVN